MASVAHHDSATPDSAISRAFRQALQSSDGLLEWLQIGIYSCDADGYLVQYNRRAAELWGQSPAISNRETQFCGAHSAYRTTGDRLPLSEAPMAELLQTGHQIRDRELVLERPDGSRLTVLANLDPLYDEKGKLVGGVNCFQDVTERRAAEEDKALLLRELAHRVNNTFAVILAVAQQTLRTAPSAKAFVETFTGRLQALAEAHNLLLAEDWSGADLGDLAKGQLAPFCFEAQDRLTIEGPKVTLVPAQAIALGVVLHELGTNAAKYGALSNGRGTVELSWTLGPGRVNLAWAERHGPPVAPPSRKGLGSKLIQRGLPDATIDWRFEADGVVCAIDLPLAERRPRNGNATRG
jgi:PAS domain S-box-containing protein